MIIYYTVNMHKDERKKALITVLHDYCERRGLVYFPDSGGDSSIVCAPESGGGNSIVCAPESGGDSHFIFDKNEQGKPYLRGTVRKRPQSDADLGGYKTWSCEKVCFSISHSGRFWVCGIHDSEVGIDIEDLECKKRTADKDRFKKIADRFFDSKEAAYIKSEEDFFSIWTRKEAYVKYEGTGIARGFKSFSTVGNDNRLVNIIRGSAGEKTAYIGEIRFSKIGSITFEPRQDKLSLKSGEGLLDLACDNLPPKLERDGLPDLERDNNGSNGRQLILAYCSETQLDQDKIEIIYMSKDKMRNIQEEQGKKRDKP